MCRVCILVYHSIQGKRASEGNLSIPKFVDRTIDSGSALREFWNDFGYRIIISMNPNHLVWIAAWSDLLLVKVTVKCLLHHDRPLNGFYRL